MEAQILSEQNLPTSSEGIRFKVDKDIIKNNLVFKFCTFVFSENSSLDLSDCIIEGCTFEGLPKSKDNLSKGVRLSIRTPKNFQTNEVKNTFTQIDYINTHGTFLRDSSICLFLTFENTEMTQGLFVGSCRNLFLTECLFHSYTSYFGQSKWEKVITKEAECSKVIFENIRVNPYYFATKCHDKSSLDLSQAILIDHWSRLRKKYSGLSLFIIFFLTFLFFTPLFLRSFFLISLSHVTPSYLTVSRIQLWDAIFFDGKSGIVGFLHCALTSLLIAYNTTRLFLTISISRLREEEFFLKDSNFNSVSVHPEKIRYQVAIDKYLSVILWISIGYTLYRLISSLFIYVPIFN